MKKLFSILVMVLFALCISAQEKEVTKFLGIPVDGYKAEMKKKLISKGFTPKTVQGSEFFEGEFNGHDVHVYIVTNNNKVRRIMLCDVITMDEANIKIRFNNLVYQFENNNRYFAPEKQTISEKEDISYQMTVRNKTYEAVFYQMNRLILTKEDAQKESEEIMNRPVWFTIAKSYGEYYIVMYYDNKYNEANGEDL